MCGGKTRYKDQAAAAFAIENMEWDQPIQGSLRAYRCEYCDRWHLTSQVQR
jgi:hypothetical protein